jgi:predicted RNA methylase
MMQDWEAAYAPYDEATYQFVLDHITAQDVVLDIGAGDLRLARRVADVAQKVYAVERQVAVLPQLARASWPAWLIVINADAQHWSFPPDVTVAVLLMRHCTPEHFAGYVKRLLATTRCTRLLTNARWKMGVEEMDLRSREPYNPDRVGWYACRCGGIGFTPGDPQLITSQLLAEVIEVERCPQCLA